MEKIVFITGASSGIGKATAIKLAEEGYKVYGAARNTAIIPVLPGIHPVYIDLTDSDSIEEAIGIVLAKEGRIDILINNAGYGFYGTLEDVPLEEARKEMEVNLFSIAHLCQLVLPGMRKNEFGKIVNVSSIAGKMATPLGGWYHASKFALEGLSDTLRQEVEDFGIDVVIIEPGIIHTPWWEKARHNLNRVSHGSDYADKIQQWRTVLNPEKASEPSVIADVILKALEAEKPKTRYSAGEDSGIILGAKKILGDRAFDKAVDKMTEREAKK
ncbi:MAG: SDR family NAD(P)-dependent oxidoreductase [Bacteroidales bacterium]|nr:SDR family NAD(P)-dependent oxidoreductase [Bacteroidales bacterium]